MPADLDLEREFSDLVETLREDRMEIDPFFVRELDAKVAAGFPRKRRRPSFGQIAAPALVLSTLVAGVVGLSQVETASDEDSMSASSGAQIAEDSAGAGGGSVGATEDAAGDEALQYESSARQRAKSVTPAAGRAAPSAGSPRSDNRETRKVETSASLVLGARPGGVQDLVNRITYITRESRGFVMSSSVDTIDGGGGAAMELRIRSDRLQDALRRISAIADVREQREASQDITQEFVSARSRLADARAERKGLLRQLERATDDATRERVKAQLREVGRRISAAKTALARVNNRASYSTVIISVVGDPTAGAAVDDGKWTPGDALRDAVRVLEVAVGVLLIALAIGLPLALLAALGLIAARLTQRRRRERLLDAI